MLFRLIFRPSLFVIDLDAQGIQRLIHFHRHQLCQVGRVNGLLELLYSWLDTYNNSATQEWKVLHARHSVFREWDTLAATLARSLTLEAAVLSDIDVGYERLQQSILRGANAGSCKVLHEIMIETLLSITVSSRTHSQALRAPRGSDELPEVPPDCV